MPDKGQNKGQNKGQGEKARLRAFYKKKLTRLPPSIKRQKEKQIEDLLLKLPFWSHISHIAGFLALKEEPLLSSFYKLYENKLCFPYMSKGRLEFYQLKGSKNLAEDRDKLQTKAQARPWPRSKEPNKSKAQAKPETTSKDQTEHWPKTGISTDNRFSIPEPYPLAENKVPSDEISVFLIPALAFDRQGGRLGRGLGFYDKSLAKLLPSKTNRGHKNACFIGLAFSLQIQTERLSLEAHDIPMDLLVSEDFILMPLNKRMEQVRIFND